ncbi:MAG: hypothetical protein QOI35_3274 [Cryptosporangiaceae bacterium]|nr:hypothetical protein [Cryptosporangiaceae bacterium]
MNRRNRRRMPTTTATVAVLMLGLAAPVALLAQPAAAAANTDFYSSFEPSDPQPTWTNQVETDAAGNRRTAGVDGGGTVGLPGNISDKVSELTASGENAGAGETKERLFDGDIQSKWLTFAPTGWVQAKLSEPEAVVHYVIASANDAPERDPQDWTIKASQDGQTWTTIDTETGVTWSKRFESKEYKFTNDTKYLYYRIDVTKNWGATDALQFSELQLANSDPAPPPAADMFSQVGNGPVSSPAAKTSAGFTGMKAFQYSGQHTADGRGYSYNKVFDVDLAVTDKTELSYKIFPEQTDDDLAYRSTYASVDLAFSDGTYLSSLNPTDEQSMPLTPTGQGQARTVYQNQWNSKRSVIGAVAAGKTIKRILVGYDAPSGPGRFKGWVDDLKIDGNPPSRAKARLTEYASTIRGTQSSSSYSRGNNFPATAVPHGFNFWTPVTNAGSLSWLYEYSRMNNAQNLPTLQAFSVSHEPSPWMGDRQTFQVMPSLASGTPDATRTARALPFKHENEIAQPHYYSVAFENGIKTEIAPTDHAAMMRFTYPGSDANLIFDNVNNNGGLTLDKDGRTVTGFSDQRSGLSVGAGRMFVYGVLDKPVTASGMLPNGGGANVTGYMKTDLGDSKTLTLRIATSFLSVDQAKKNLALEITDSDTFDNVKNRAEDAWDAKMKTIQVEGATSDQLTTLYSNLYRLNLYPNSAFENTGTSGAPVYKYASPVAAATGQNTPTQTGSKVSDGTMYVNNGFWDTYRTTWSAYTLLTPKTAGQMVDGFANQYKDGGWISRWSSPGYADLMTGTSSDAAFADAYVKGVRNFDAQAVYDAAVKNAMVTAPNGAVGRKGNNTARFLGYTPDSTGESVSWALEGFVNDNAISNMSKAMYDAAAPTDPRKNEYKDNIEYFRNRAQNYVHLFDPNVNFFQGKDEKGNWRLTPDKYDPRVWGFDYTETDGWNFAFSAPQDGQGLANLYGGKDKLASKLDTFFSTPETAQFTGSYGGVIHEMIEARDVRMGQYGHSNQVSHHITYMYDYAGQPSKTQAKVRDVLQRLYSGSDIGQGYTGDEDNGEQSAWAIFSSLGFYPLVVGDDKYAVGSPLFKKATVNLENGKKIVINAPNNSAKNVYIQGMKVNGNKWGRTYLRHDTLAAGATIDFDMGPNPSSWGTGADQAPPSITTGPAVPNPLADSADLATGVATGSDNTSTNALFDNTSDTRVTFTSATPWVQYQYNGPRQRAVYYTLTSGDKAGDPTGWVLKGSYNGKTWTTLDTRTAQKFDSRLQTKAFKVANPNAYPLYRLEITGNTGETTTSLAELELLSKPVPQ